jgi:hypothetical protein
MRVGGSHGESAGAPAESQRCPNCRTKIVVPDGDGVVVRNAILRVSARTGYGRPARRRLYFCVGGAVGKHQATARPIGYRIAASEVPEAIERLLLGYLDLRRAGENFRQFCARYTDDELRALLAGGEVAVAARDPSPGRAPHSVEG